MIFLTFFMFCGCCCFCFAGGRRTLEPVNPTQDQALECDVPYEQGFRANDIFGPGEIIKSSTISGVPPFLTSSDTLELKSSVEVSGGWCHDVFVSGDFVYFAKGNLGLEIFDVSDPTSPTFLGSYDGGVDVRAVYVAGDYSYVTETTNDRFLVIDISNSSAPILQGSCDLAADLNARSVYVAGSHAYVANAAAGLQIIDISNATDPIIAGSFNTPGSAQDVFVSGDYAYLADGGGGFRMVDVSNSSLPKEVGSISPAPSVLGVYVSGDFAYLACHDSGLKIVDISNSSSPLVVGSVDTLGQARRVYVYENFAYVATLLWLEIFEISNSSSPTIEVSFQPGGPDSVLKAFVSGDEVYLAAENWFHVLDRRPIVILSGTTCEVGDQYEITFTACNEETQCGEDKFDIFVNCPDEKYVGFNGSCTLSCPSLGSYFNDDISTFRKCSSCSAHCGVCSSSLDTSCTECEGNWDIATLCQSCLNYFEGNDCEICPWIYSTRNGLCNEVSEIAVFVIVFCTVGAVIFVFLCFVFVFSFLVWYFVRKKFRKFGDLEDVDLLLEEQRVEKDTLTPKHKLNKSLFEVDPATIKILGKLGQGGGGAVVYRSEWKDQMVAYKVFKTHDFLEEDKYKEFEKELEILSSISFPFVLTFYGATLNESRLGILMEFCANGDLENFLKKRKGTYSMKGKLRLLSQVSSAMAFLHSRQIIHRDLKAENVLVTDQEISKVMDFGLSKFDLDDKTKTRKVGTSIYMAPEVLTGDYTYSCDVFSFAILFYCVVTENWLPYGRQTHGIESRIAGDKNFRPSFVGFSLSKEMKKLIARNWNHNAEKRMKFEEVLPAIKELEEKEKKNPNSKQVEQFEGIEKFKKEVKEANDKLRKANKRNEDLKEKNDGFQLKIKELKKQNGDLTRRIEEFIKGKQNNS